MDLYKNIALKVSKKYVNHQNLVGIIWIGSSTFGINDKDADMDNKKSTRYFKSLRGF